MAELYKKRTSYIYFCCHYDEGWDAVNTCFTGEPELLNPAGILYKTNKVLVIADPVGSVVADAVNTGSYKYENGSWLVEGIGEDHIPGNLNLDIIDEGIYVSDKDAFEMLNKLLQEEGILAGTSCGTLVHAAVEWCKLQKTPKKVVTLICDTGNKYLSKAYNKEWLEENF